MHVFVFLLNFLPLQIKKKHYFPFKFEQVRSFEAHVTLVVSGCYLKTNNPHIFILPQELNKVSIQLDQVTAKLNDKQEYCAQLEANLKEYKEKHLYLEQKTEELEGQLKVCIKNSL